MNPGRLPPYTDTMNEQQYDLIIVGGGMVGATLAIALSGHGLKLALVEAAEPRVEAVPNYDDRAIALAYGAQRIFQALGLWPELARRAAPIRHIHVSEQGGFGIAHLDAEEEAVPALGQVITARDLGEVLLARLARLDDLDLIAPARVRWAAVADDLARVGLDDERQLTAPLLVAADGGDSFIRDHLGFVVERRAYHQSALVANVTPGRPHGDTAYERFTAQGPLALLPMPGDRCGLVWTLADENLDQHLALDDDSFLARLQAAFGWRLGRFQKVGRRAGYPLQQLLVPETVKPRVAVIGNAAHTLHPVAGQGFNLGIRDLAVLAEVVLDAHRAGQDPGSEAVLDRYRQWRQQDQQRVARLTDGLVRLFSNRWPPLRLGRNLGLLGLELCPPARHRIARTAMGLEGRLPRLARGLPL